MDRLNVSGVLNKYLVDPLHTKRITPLPYMGTGEKIFMHHFFYLTLPNELNISCVLNKYLVDPLQCGIDHGFIVGHIEDMLFSGGPDPVEAKIFPLCHADGVGARDGHNLIKWL